MKYRYTFFFLTKENVQKVGKHKGGDFVNGLGAEKWRKKAPGGCGVTNFVFFHSLLSFTAMSDK